MQKTRFNISPGAYTGYQYDLFATGKCNICLVCFDIDFTIFLANNNNSHVNHPERWTKISLTYFQTKILWDDHNNKM